MTETQEPLVDVGAVTQAAFTMRSRNPDVLSCIANLSSDEVFTPPEFANQMLDTLAEGWAAANHGANIWSDSTVTFLDPFTKSGVFLREITKRLVEGLAEQIPVLEDRVDHILTKQVYGMGITEITALLARRSLYCSKRANGEHSIAKSFGLGEGFGNADGHIWFERTEHTWVGGTNWVYTADGTGKQVKRFTDGRCKFCGTPQSILDRGVEAETYAYAFIHTDDVQSMVKKIFGEDMHFDVVVGNPPYQLDDGGHNNSAAPIYQLFVESAMGLDPSHIVMVTPSRWFSGGRGLDKFRAAMLSDRRLRNLVDFPKLYDGFPGVKIRGGISYFVWSRDYDGPCLVQTMWDNAPLGDPVSRFLNDYDVLIRRNEAVSILQKVKKKSEPTLDQRVSAGKPFNLRTFYHGADAPTGLVDPVKLYGSQRISWVERSAIPANQEWVDDWKVLMTAVQGTSAAVETKFLSKPIIAGPGTACTETYLVAGRFESEEAARAYAAYLRTRFVRFLVSLRKSTQHANRGVYAFVPDLAYDRSWTDEELAARYGLTEDEVSYIESQIALHDGDEEGAAS